MLIRIAESYTMEGKEREVVSSDGELSCVYTRQEADFGGPIPEFFLSLSHGQFLEIVERNVGISLYCIIKIEIIELEEKDLVARVRRHDNLQFRKAQNDLQFGKVKRCEELPIGPIDFGLEFLKNGVVHDMRDLI